MLDREERLRGVEVIGMGGVSDRAGFERMRDVGAKVVGVGTALGREGVEVFGKIVESGV
jgi:dihydroorotate dehydrogenase (fumarate)